jgi:2-polyprenyl-3-methyl-5-hydroxy-6-metoxy-1,4-benzoquinol methylase
VSKTIEYYNSKAQDFYERTIRLDLKDGYNLFLKHLPQGARILDAGCGSGRDSKYF